MKKILLFTLLLASLCSFAQTENPFPRTITVSGSAEMELVPDEIYVQVDLKEYDKKGQGKINIDRIKSDFLSRVKALGIADSLISIAGYDGQDHNPWLRKKKKSNELFASISYQLKLKNSAQLDAVVNVLDDEATTNFFIVRTAHSNLTEYRKQLKIKAVQAAREKAGYLTAAIGEQAGVAVTISEPSEYYMPYTYNIRGSNTAMRQESTANISNEMSNVDFRKIKLKYDVTVVFALK